MIQEPDVRLTGILFEGNCIAIYYIGSIADNFT